MESPEVNKTDARVFVMYIFLLWNCQFCFICFPLSVRWVSHYRPNFSLNILSSAHNMSTFAACCFFVSFLCFWLLLIATERVILFAGCHMKIVVRSSRNEIINASTSYSMTCYVLKVTIVWQKLVICFSLMLLNMHRNNWSDFSCVWMYCTVFF